MVVGRCISSGFHPCPAGIRYILHNKAPNGVVILRIWRPSYFPPLLNLRMFSSLPHHSIGYSSLSSPHLCNGRCHIWSPCSRNSIAIWGYQWPDAREGLVYLDVNETLPQRHNCHLKIRVQYAGLRPEFWTYSIVVVDLRLRNRKTWFPT